MADMYQLRFKNVPEKPNQTDDACWKFATFLGACVTFHQDLPRRAIEPDDAQLDKQSLQKLYVELNESFSEHLYVDRREEERILQLVPGAHCVVVAGPLGCGKTTLLFRVAHQLRKRSVFVHYVNLKRRASELRALGPGAKHSSVCDLLQADIYKEFVEGKGLTDSFTVHLVKIHSRYARLFQSITQNLAPKSESEWLQAIRSGSYLEEKIRLDMGIGAPASAAEDLRVILHFLRETHGVPLVLILDNTDRFGHDLQTELLTSAIDLSDVMTPVIAIRRLPLPQRPQNQGKYADKLEIIELSRPEESEQTNSLVRRYIDNRLSYFIRVASKYDIAPLKTETLRTLKDLIGKLLHVRLTSSMLGICEDWYNHSLRHMGAAIVRLATKVVCERDPVFSMEYLQSTSSGNPEISQRPLRTMLYKQISCGDGFVYASGNGGVLNIFDSPDKSPVAPFPELLLLAHCRLETHRNSRLTLKSLRDFLACVGLAQAAADRVIDRVRRRQWSDGFGLLFVETEEDSIATPKAPVSVDAACLVDYSGEFFLSTLTTTCEYLFWMTIGTRTVKVNPFLRHVEMDYVELSRADCSKAGMVAAFLLETVIPMAELSLGNLQNVSMPRRSEVLDIYKDYFCSCARSLSVFVSMAGSRMPNYSRAVDQIKKFDERANGLR